jgi:hypothetical protein
MSVVDLSGQLHIRIRRAPESLLEIIARARAVRKFYLDPFTSKKPRLNLLQFQLTSGIFDNRSLACLIIIALVASEALMARNSFVHVHTSILLALVGGKDSVTNDSLEKLW